MPNGKIGDNPLSDFIVHGQHPFPPEIEALLTRIEKLGRRPRRWPLGENWPFSPSAHATAVQGGEVDFVW